MRIFHAICVLVIYVALIFGWAYVEEVVWVDEKWWHNPLEFLCGITLFVGLFGQVVMWLWVARVFDRSQAESEAQDDG